MGMQPAYLALASEAPRTIPRARVWRPVPEPLADILCVEDAPGNLAPRIHGRFGITLIRSPALVRVESSRSLSTPGNRILLIPRLQLYAVQTQRGVSQGTVTLLLEASDLDGLDVPYQPALVTDPECSAQAAALVAGLPRFMGSIGCGSVSRGMLQRMIARSTPLNCARSERPTRLLAVREYLQGHLGEPIPTAALAEISGLTECHLIRAFHLEFGLPPHAYHLRLRLAVAAELLSQGLSVSTVAYECGFADQSHLSRKFKAVYGATPAAWAAAASGRTGYDMGLSSAELEHPFAAVRGRAGNAGRC